MTKCIAVYLRLKPTLVGIVNTVMSAIKSQGERLRSPGFCRLCGSCSNTHHNRYRVMLDSLKKHALAIVVAILFATYRLSRLESERGRREAAIEQEFDKVVDFLQQHLDTKYRVLQVTPSSHAVVKLHAMVINGGFAIPRVEAEAEVFVDQQFVLDQRKQNRIKDRPSVPSVRFRVYDADAMTSIAKTLQQHNLIASYELGYQPN